MTVNKVLIALIVLLTASACANPSAFVSLGQVGATGTSCTTTQTANGAVITCQDGTTSVITNGQNGNDGQSCTVTPNITGVVINCINSTANVNNGNNGSNGLNGHSLVFTSTSALPVQCTTGGTVFVMAVDTNDNNVLDLSDDNIQTAIVCNGMNGTDGQNAAPTPFAPVDYVMPCGNTVAYKEVLLVLADGNILASFSENVEGRNTRLSFIPDGNYTDTDSSNCQFNVSTNGTVRTVSWSGGSKSWNLN